MLKSLFLSAAISASFAASSRKCRCLPTTQESHTRTFQATHVSSINSLLSGPSARHMPFPIPAPQMPCIRTCKYMNMTLHLYARHTARTRASHLRTTAPRKNHYCGGSCCRACVTCIGHNTNTHCVHIMTCAIAMAHESAELTRCCCRHHGPPWRSCASSLRCRLFWRRCSGSFLSASSSSCPLCQAGFAPVQHTHIHTYTQHNTHRQRVNAI